MQKLHNSDVLQSSRLELYPFMDQKIRRCISTMRSIGTEILHRHPVLEIGQCMEGSGIFFIDNEIYPFSAGDISIVFPEEKHDAFRSSGTKTRWEFLFINVEKLFSGWGEQSLLLSMCSLPHAGHILSAEEKQLVQPYIRRLLSLLSPEDFPEDTPVPDGLYENCAALTACILYDLQPFCQRQAGGQETEVSLSFTQQTVIYPAVQHMFLHYADEITTEELCRLCFISPSYLYRSFECTFRMSPIAFLHKIRMQHACAALAGTDDPVLEIAVRCGYTTLSSFNRQFRKLMKMSPSQYRKLAGRENAGEE